MRIVIFIFFSFLFLSCSRNEEPDILGFYDENFPQTWELHEVYSSFTQKSITAEEAAVAETYSFLEDGSFKKSVSDEFVVGDSNGTYETKRIDELDYLVLTFDDEADVLSYCDFENQEFLMILDSGRVLDNGYCTSFDALGYSYRRLE